MKVIFNADDYGLTRGVTDGIIKAHVDGVVTATTMMMNGRAVDYAVEQAKQNPALQVGIHLVLSSGRPLSDNVPDLVDTDGFFRFKNTFSSMEPPNIQQVEIEWRTQIEAFIKTGLPLHHIDSHHHIHGWEPLKEVVIRLAEDYNVPVRYVDSLKERPDLLLTEALFLEFYGESISTDIFTELKKLPVNTVEVMTHPAYVDTDLEQLSSYRKLREKELEILCSIEYPDWVENPA
ncbi:MULTISPECIES: chitin disaccharide deacetylase [unclassified Virgibacillus]|uniref:chitin disaccharide deacetylase n=1 Tax=unclassified Virgibacillus TaxID=2620237 RepID=UPI0024DE4CBE|nr:chitin disaccharide deacetylase [Virgibacillus sp. LDC-1]